MRSAIAVVTGLLLLSPLFTNQPGWVPKSVQAHLEQAGKYQYGVSSVLCPPGITSSILFQLDGPDLPCLGPECNTAFARLLCVTQNSPLALETLTILALASVWREILDPNGVLLLSANSEDLTRRALPWLLW